MQTLKQNIAELSGFTLAVGHHLLNVEGMIHTASVSISNDLVNMALGAAITGIIGGGFGHLVKLLINCAIKQIRK